MPNHGYNKLPRTSRRAQLLRQLTGFYLGLKRTTRINPQSSRSRLDFFAGLIPSASGVQVEEAKIAGRYANWLRPAAAATGQVLLYWHGGAYVMGSCKSHRPLVSHLARASGVSCLLPEYRLAPEHPFPAALDDAVSVYRGLLSAGFEPANIVVAGDSAGGGLTVAMLLALKAAGEPLPAAAVLLSPWLDLSGQGESMQTRRSRDPWFNPDDLPAVARHYCRPEQLCEPLVSPVFGELTAMPPCLIQVGNDEILLSDSARLAEKLTASGCQVELDVWPGMWHVWQMFIGLMPESRVAVDRCGRFIRGVLGHNQPQT